MEESTRSRPFYRSPFFWSVILGCLTITFMRPFLRHIPEPPPVIGEIPMFSLVAADGRPFGSEDLAGQVYVANFFFTRCTSICPLLIRNTAELQDHFERNGIEDIRLISISVDPEYDRPEVLKAYGKTHGVNPERWTLLTGERDLIRRVVEGGFMTAMGSVEETGPGLVDIAHTGKMVLVDRQGRIRGYYDSDEMGLDEVYHRSQHVANEDRQR